MESFHISNLESRQALPFQFIDDIEINLAVVMRVLGKLKSNAAAGSDRIPAILYRKTSTISIPLSIIFRTCFELRNLPSEWKFSIITPKLKKTHGI